MVEKKPKTLPHVARGATGWLRDVLRELTRQRFMRSWVASGLAVGDGDKRYRRGGEGRAQLGVRL